MSNSSESYAGTQAVVRAIRLLKIFNDDQTEWSLSELVDTAALNKTTTFRILTALESEGLIEKTDTGNYRLGSEMIALGGRAMRSNSLRHVAHPILRQLAETTGERVTLEVLINEEQMLVLDEVASNHLLGVTHYVGNRLPVHATSTGKAVLAFAQNGEAILPAELPMLTEQTHPTAVSLHTELAEIRKRGYATAVGELEPGLMATAAPIFDHNGRVVGALSVVGPSVRLDETKLHTAAQHAVQAAAEISYKLGARFKVQGATAPPAP